MRPNIDLWSLLPAYHRRQDADQGYPLRALLRVIAEQAEVVRHGFDALADDPFIETCDRWVIPYVGDLVANDPLHGGDRRGEDPYRALFRDLVGSPPGGLELRPPPMVPLRTDVAKTIYYRRRKGTAAMLEELARDVTGWGARVAEAFELLEWTQNDDHVRPGDDGRPFPGSVEVRHVEPVDRVDGPFDRWSHSADVRPTGRREGWHNLPNVLVFLWRLASYPLERVTPRPVEETDAGEWRFHFSPLGQPAPLFVNPAPFPKAGGGGTPRVTELQVPAPVRRAFFYDDLVRYRDSEARPRPLRTGLYGPSAGDGSFQVWLGAGAVPPVSNAAAEPEDFPALRRVVCRRLDPWPPRPTGEVVAIDPASGRLALGTGIDPAAEGPVEVSFNLGFSADLGGGPYERRAWAVEPFPDTVERTVGADPGADHPDLVAALGDWAAAPPPNRRSWIITILDSRTYVLPSSLSLFAGGALTIQAANRQRPLLRTAAGGVLSVDSAEVAADPAVAASLTLGGVVVEGRVEVVGELRRLRLLHATLEPGRSLDPDDGGPVSGGHSLRVAGDDGGGTPINARLRLEMAFAVSGGLRLPEHAEGMWIYDSIVDGVRFAGATGAAVAGLAGDDSPGPPATLERVTVFGRAAFRALPLASESIFTGRVTVQRRQVGCVRFSWVPAGSVTPRRFRCQPDLAIEAAEAAAEEAGTALAAGDRADLRRRLAPRFADRRYGQPAYAQLSTATAAEILTGAEDGSEMGAFGHLQPPQRETNLRIRLGEYLPFGLTPGLVFVT